MLWLDAGALDVAAGLYWQIPTPILSATRDIHCFLLSTVPNISTLIPAVVRVLS